MTHEESRRVFESDSHRLSFTFYITKIACGIEFQSQVIDRGQFNSRHKISSKSVCGKSNLVNKYQNYK